ncbi:Urease [Bienertia sinuspersici]
MIVTVGDIDCHVLFICPQLSYKATSSGENLISCGFHILPSPFCEAFVTFVGITTMVGGGIAPAEGKCVTTCTFAPSQMKFMLQSTDNLPQNFGFTGKGNSNKAEGHPDIIFARAMGLKLHED